MTFGKALEKLKRGGRVARMGWNGKDQWLVIANSQCSTDIPIPPWIGMRTQDNTFIPWTASQTDLLANDWYSTSN